MDHILCGLNEAQKAAVTSPAAVLQVLAPPGSGKTKTLTARVAYLIARHGLAPRDIIVCTFTVKAAREMKERICAFLGEDVAGKLILGTFHSVARRFLASHGKEIGLDEKFGIADTTDTTNIVSRIIKRHKFELKPSQARARISTLKAKSQTAEQYALTAAKADQQQFAVIYREYEDQLRVSNLLDYDDLLMRCVELLRRFPSCVSRIQSVLIDEFQDTNSVQFELMQLLAQHQESITIVGDPDQSIYGWRSAEIKNLARMRERYPETHVAVLEENYRSSGSILITAQEVIEQDQSRPAKRLMATHSVGVQPVFRRLPDAHKEADWIVSEIQRTSSLSAGLLHLNDYAVLLRSAYLSRVIENVLGKVGIPYRMVGGHKFYDRVEVKLVLDYLRAICHPEHNDSVLRIVNVPPRHVGASTIGKLVERAETERTTLWKLIREIVRDNTKAPEKTQSKTLGGLKEFTSLILSAQEHLHSCSRGSSSLADYICYLLDELGLEEYFKTAHPEEFESRWANVEELLTQAGEFSVDAEESRLCDDLSDEETDAEPAAQSNTMEDALHMFLSNVALATDTQPVREDGQAHEVVTLSTIHAAKGLEWPVVFIPATYNGSLPHSRAEDTDEERRLLYVAMTRAQCLLYLSQPMKNSGAEDTTISPFLAHRPMDALFRKRGEDFSFEIVKEIACILRRPCPGSELVARALASCEYPRDTRWPLTGDSSSKNLDEEHYPTAEEGSWQHRASTKRPRFGSGGFHGSRQNLRETTSVFPFSGTTTMQNQSSRTYTVGFTTAATALTTMKAEAEPTVESTAPNQGQKAKAKSIASKRRAAVADRGAADQSSLTDYFKRPSSLPRPENEKSPVQDGKRPAAAQDITNLIIPEPEGVGGEQRRIASTLHVTSMQQVNGAVAKRRTLGVRRDIGGGWDARMARERSG